jgi:hypothetical protein
MVNIAAHALDESFIMLYRFFSAYCLALDDGLFWECYVIKVLWESSMGCFVDRCQIAD